MTNLESTTPSINLKKLDKDFIYDLMSVPSYSKHEYRIVSYIILWARRNNIDYEFDNYGNVYLTKGELDEGEFYPCVTSHMDTVQTEQELYAKAGQPLEILTRQVGEKHEIYCDRFGIGGDDKAGVAICLSMFKYVEKLKACFFLEEEIGCVGSNNLSVNWFTNVGYVIGFDSPDLNRAAYACSGVKLFGKDFYETYMKDICTKYGLTDFRSEPFTDVKVIREKTNLMCMNFGTGYYRCHQATEYCVLEDMDHACDMGLALIEHIGRQQFLLENPAKTTNSYDYYYSSQDPDMQFFRREFSSYYGTTYGGTYKSKTSTSTNTSAKAAATSTNDKNVVNVGDIIAVYAGFIEQIESSVKNKCDELNVNFDETFKECFDTEIKF